MSKDEGYFVKRLGICHWCGSRFPPALDRLLHSVGGVPRLQEQHCFETAVASHEESA